ncbi:hypothetical protein F2Q70_00018750 [Brassica cretica]|uniref:Uncharacterized protein n=1 Tax=Brassica cretica TaxID=69181 RepID=A0A8S9I567_BRACR|nr:hypothetical protein F2Q70_00018750 [Brassica cretica]KAF2597299.1 hypothetical protein F2Q68_00012343 [Brassica cretica]
MAFSSSQPSPTTAVGSGGSRIVQPGQPSLLNLSFEHPHPPTKLMFIPPSLRLPSGDLLASSGDFLRFLEMKRLHHRQPRRCPQQQQDERVLRTVNLLQLERHRRKRLRTCSIHTTCTIWDLVTRANGSNWRVTGVSRRVVNLLQLERHRAKATQNLQRRQDVHDLGRGDGGPDDKEVHDITWGEARVFVTVSADGSLEYLTCTTRNTSLLSTPLLRLAWNKQNLRYMATILMDSNELGLRRVVSKFVRVVMMKRRCFGELPTVAGPNWIDPMSVYSAGSEINSCSGLVRCLIGLALLFLVKCSSLKFELELVLGVHACSAPLDADVKGWKLDLAIDP